MGVRKPDISWYPRSLVLQTLGISDSSLYRYAKALRKTLSRDEFDWKLRDKGFSSLSVEALKALVTLLKAGMSLKEALNKIKLEGF